MLRRNDFGLNATLITAADPDIMAMMFPISAKRNGLVTLTKQKKL